MTPYPYSNYSILDQAVVLDRLFHPRPEALFRMPDGNRDDLLIPVDESVRLGASCHFINRDAPMILFFHGNGEVVSDYDDMGRFYMELGINFFVVDYRGYGESGGRPSVTAMLEDAHIVLDYLLSYMGKKEYTGPICLMGRSLGSAPAIELASKRSDDISCLIIESGFAYVSPLLRVLGIDPDLIGYREEKGFENIDKIKTCVKPCLIIHAQYDHIIDFTQGEALYNAAGSSRKFFQEVKGADHNDIFYKGMELYLKQIEKICFM